MNRLLPLLFISFLCFSQSIFAQTTTPEKQDPLKDSIDKYEKERLWAKVLPFAEQWEAKLKKEKHLPENFFWFVARHLCSAKCDRSIGGQGQGNRKTIGIIPTEAALAQKLEKTRVPASEEV